MFAPFTVDEGVDSQVYITPLDSCLPWPVPPKDLSPGAPGAPLPPSVHYPAVPTLVLSGDLDSITSVIDASETAARFPDAVHVVVPNLGHVVTDSDEIDCTLDIVHDFTLKSGGTQIGNLQIRWNDADINARATVTGSIQGATLNADRIAP